jgi:hypothetical protein
MIVNLENVSYVTVSEMRVELHFKDTSTYMSRFGSVGEMLTAIGEWEKKTKELNNGRPVLALNASGKRSPMPRGRVTRGEVRFGSVGEMVSAIQKWERRPRTLRETGN